VSVKVTRHKRLDILIRWYKYYINPNAYDAVQFFCHILSEEQTDGTSFDCDVLDILEKDLDAERTIPLLLALKQKYTDE